MVALELAKTDNIFGRRALFRPCAENVANEQRKDCAEEQSCDQTSGKHLTLPRQYAYALGLAEGINLVSELGYYPLLHPVEEILPRGEFIIEIVSPIVSVVFALRYLMLVCDIPMHNTISFVTQHDFCFMTAFGLWHHCPCKCNHFDTSWLVFQI
jgi:hypothetical protein